MRAAVIDGYGGVEALTVRDVPKPVPGAGQVLIRVRASSLNPLDWKLRRGRMRLLVPLKLPAILGFDVAGQVEAVGPRCARFSPGEAVYGSVPKPGTHAEYAAADESGLAAKPAALSFEEAAAMPGAGLTALQALRDRAGLQPGQRVLINGASGGVGSFAVQLAIAFGARATGVAGTGSLELVRGLGAERVVDHTREDFAKGGEAYDVVFDVVANRSFPECAGVLKSGGVYVTTWPGPGPFLWSLLGPLAFRKRCRWVMVRPNAAGLETLTRLVGEGKLRPVIDTVYSLDEIARAHEHAEKGHPRGKIVIRMV